MGLKVEPIAARSGPRSARSTSCSRTLSVHPDRTLSRHPALTPQPPASRQTVAERTHGDLRSVLEAECTEEVARTSPGRSFSQLIDVIGGVQRRHPLIGCLVHIDRSDGFRGAFKFELREYVAGHITTPLPARSRKWMGATAHASWRSSWARCTALLMQPHRAMIRSGRRMCSRRETSFHTLPMRH